MSSNFNTSGGASSLSQLKDLDISTKTDGDFLQYDATAGKFKAKPLSLPQTVLGLRIADYPRLSSETDDTRRFQRAFADLTTAGGGNLFIGAETLTVAPDTLSIPSNVNIEGLGSVSVINMTATSGTFFNIIGASYIKLEHVKFTAPNSTIKVIGIDIASSDLIINNVVCENPWMIDTINLPDYSTFNNESQLLKRITIQNCILKGDGAGGPPAINISFCDTATVTNNNISFYGTGIQWWGGDSYPGTDGARTNPRWCRNLHISNNHVTDVQGGGIWGSMGQNVTVNGNTVQRCGDVGIDVEGCFYTTIQGNVVKDCTNGGITLFFINRGILVTGNIVTTSTAQPLFKIYGGQHDGGYNDVTATGNTFECLASSVGNINLRDAESIVFSNNSVKNVSVSLTYSSTIIANGNRIYYTYANSAAFNALDLGNAWIVASHNQIYSTSAQPTGSIGINYANSDQFLPTPTILLEGNVISGFPIDVKTNVTINAYILIRGNIVGGNISNTGGTFILEDNRKTGSLTVYP